jgi:hypothetical protein
MKTLIAVSTCHKFEKDGSNDAIRETWLRDDLPPGFDYKFFVGDGPADKADTVSLNCGDGYEHLTYKTLGKLKWAVDHGYDFVFCAMADTYVRPERLAVCGFEHFDAFGTFVSVGPSPKFLCGGSGYFLSQVAAKIILAGPKPVSRHAETYEDGFITSRLRHMRDMLIGDDLNLFASQGTGPRAWNKVTTRHLHFRLCHELVYIPQMMRDEHRSWEDSVTAELVRETKPQRKVSWWSRNPQVATSTSSAASRRP